MRGFLFCIALPSEARQEERVNRREFIKLGGVAAVELGAAKLRMPQSQPGMAEMPGTQSPAPSPKNSKADFTLRIAPVTVDLIPTRIISTIG